MSDDIDTQAVRRFGHPGAGRRRAAPHAKGRQVETIALDEVRTLLGDAPRRRDLLIEYMHLVQDRYGRLGGRHLAALAEEMRLALVEVYEVATFYAHFDVAVDGAEAEAPPAVTVRVCDSIACEMAGSAELLETLSDNEDATIRFVRAPCMGRCDCAPVAEVGHRHIDFASADAVLTAARAGETHPVVPPYPDLVAARADGAYEALAACRSGARSHDAVLATLEASGLRGMGGAGFPAHRKWRFVRAEPGPRYLAINADEGEPGTFKDRLYLESHPHAVLEGALIAAWGVEAARVYIYLRDEYPAAREILLAEIAALEAANLIEPGYIALRRGAGAYICGEESAMIESIEGKRGLPRHRPPYVAQVGLFGRPTLVHNVETVYWIRRILSDGGDDFAGTGLHGGRGWRSYSVSGRVRNPGVKLAPAGITLNELIAEYCGGMAEGHALKGYLPGGASGGILPASLADLPLDFGKLEAHGCFIGSAAVVVLSDKDDVRDVALNLMRFFEDESCGQCTPCRAGTEKAVQLMSEDEWDTGLLGELSAVMRDASICGLGQAAPNPLDCLLRYFPDDIPD
jgi:NADH:ubiquinone oxidoreductase subunit F (NADH-binding)/NADH:ubiquinone oxidoreductase subunit E